MKRIYLDQRIWIDVAKAANRHPDGQRLEDALQVLRMAAEGGRASFPLSSSHYMEIRHGTSARQRREVGGLMFELSRGNRMLSYGLDVLEAEIDAVFVARYGHPPHPRKVRIFGTGTAHTFRMGTVKGRIQARDGGEPVGLDPEVRTHLEAKAMLLFEQWTLMGPPDDVDLTDSEVNPLSHRVFEDDFLAAEEERAARLRDPRVRGRQADLIYAQALVEILDPLLRACIRAGIDPLSITAGGKVALTALLEALPVKYAATELRRLQHQNTARSWRKSDTYDLTALPMAVVHCDVVVAEKHWSHMIRRARLDKRHGTAVLTDAADLAAHLGA